jgi:hypothetical protein
VTSWMATSRALAQSFLIPGGPGSDLSGCWQREKCGDPVRDCAELCSLHDRDVMTPN